MKIVKNLCQGEIKKIHSAQLLEVLERNVGIWIFVMGKVKLSLVCNPSDFSKITLIHPNIRLVLSLL